MSEKALVFHIIHGSFVDGYGIRTTVFLKGCPLKCVWCCNPEGQSYRQELKYTAEHCTGCGKCVPVCPQGAVTMAEGKAVIDRSRCDGCMQCAEVCYFDAMEPFAKWMTAEEVFEIIRADEAFYRSSGGGATIGGGESSSFPAFMMELIGLCHGAGISVNVDTCGYTRSDAAVEVLKAADMLLFDLKDIDPENHRKNTGCSNDVILRNLRAMSELRKPMIIRVPIIPGYNDSDETLAAEADLLASLKSVERVDILPEHEYGKIKYAQLGKPYTLKAQSVSPERIEQIMELFRSRGLKVQNGG